MHIGAKRLPNPMMVALIGAITLAMTVVMVAAWFYQRAAQNGGWTDVFWTYGTGATCAAATLATINGAAATAWRPCLVAAMVALWALRLGTYVALRVHHHDEDVRYAGARREWGSKFQRNMFALLIVQGPVTGILGTAILFAACNPARGFRITDALGIIILTVAIAGETLADRQMTRFKADPANRNRVCDKGLWAWSRHPNYLFEFLGWFAYPVIGFDRTDFWSLCAIVAPLVMFAVVRFGTGVPALESAMVASKGDAYRRYQARVGTILPKLFSDRDPARKQH